MKTHSGSVVNSSTKLLACMLFLNLLFQGFSFGQSKSGLENPAAVSAGLNGNQGWTLVIHGGAGGPARGTMKAEEEEAYLLHLGKALDLGSEMLQTGGNSIDVVEAVVRYLEDCPLFNAGKGAVLNESGSAELDAAIMDGKTGMAGAVAGVKTIKNPVSAARMVMDQTPHVMLAGDGADRLAKEKGLEIVDPSYFITQKRRAAWEKWKEENGNKPVNPPQDKDKHGTVGAVALDQHGNLAAATSTGGMTGKLSGRIGDSPVIGAGTYANNATCAVSATGHGEFFIRNVVAYDLAAMIEYGQVPMVEAATAIIGKKLKNQGATGGLIAVDRQGNVAMPFNTNAMFRGFRKSDGTRETAIY